MKVFSIGKEWTLEVGFHMPLYMGPLLTLDFSLYGYCKPEVWGHSHPGLFFSFSVGRVIFEFNIYTTDPFPEGCE